MLVRIETIRGWIFWEMSTALKKGALKIKSRVAVQQVGHTQLRAAVAAQ